MKSKISLILVFVFLFSFIFSTAVNADGIEPRYNNANRTETTFTISGDGVATINVSCIGKENVTSKIEVKVEVDKRVMLLFWETAVATTTYMTYSSNYVNTFTHTLNKGSGTYRCRVTYTVYGSGGDADVIEFEDTKSW